MRIAYDNYDKPKILFETLSLPYDKISNESLIVISPENRLILNPSTIIQTLLKYDFLPNGIAQLLLILGQYIESQTVVFNELPKSQSAVLGVQIYQEIESNQQLCLAAKSLDSKIFKSYDLSALKKDSLYIKIKKALFKAGFKYSDEFIDDRLKKMGLEMPYEAMLDDLQNEARIRIAANRILNAEHDTIDQVNTYLRRVSSIIEAKHQFRGFAYSKLEALKDLIFVIYNEYPNLNLNFPLVKKMQEKPFMAQLEDLKIQLESCVEEDEKFQLLVKLAEVNERIAK